jgi:hypothetical protein
MIIGGVKFSTVRQDEKLPYAYEGSLKGKRIVIRRTPKQSLYRIYVDGFLVTGKVFDHADKAALYVMGKLS